MKKYLQNNDLINELLYKILHIIKSCLELENYEVFLFGSWSDGTAQMTSDLDVGILGEDKIDLANMEQIITGVEKLQTLRSIEIVDFFDVTKEFKEIAFKNKLILYKRKRGAE
ncbi:nucleotidyltransferase domain-containing protein [bacterium]